MSIKKDEVLEKERAAKEKKSLAAILDKIKNKKAICRYQEWKKAKYSKF